jgi:hypothetical protein
MENEMAGGGASVPNEAPMIESDDALDQRRLGETVRLLRQRAGFSIQDVAKRTGLHRDDQPA